MSKETYGDYAIFAAAIPCTHQGLQRYYGSANVVATRRRWLNHPGEVHDFDGALFDSQELAEKYAIENAISIIASRVC